MLKHRVATAAVMILLLGLGIVYLSPVGLALFFAILVLVAAWEWSNLAGLSSLIAKAIFIIVCAVFMVVAEWHTQLLSNHDTDKVRDILGLACLWWSIALLWVNSYPDSAVIWNSLAMRILMGLLTLVPAWLALVYLRVQDNGAQIICLLIVLVSSADIGAYFSGRRWGHAKLAVKVSPGKSWVGFWGGLTTSLLLSIIFWFLWGQTSYSLIAIVVITVVTIIASVLGDLLESMIKRERGIKDSGVILPGHGGMMDRLDSMTAAAPVFALSLIVVGY